MTDHVVEHHAPGVLEHVHGLRDEAEEGEGEPGEEEDQGDREEDQAGLLLSLFQTGVGNSTLGKHSYVIKKICHVSKYL